MLRTRSPLYSGPGGPFLARLACVKRAANVRSEPGSNSPVKNCRASWRQAVAPATVARIASVDETFASSNRPARPRAAYGFRFSFQGPIRCPPPKGSRTIAPPTLVVNRGRARRRRPSPPARRLVYLPKGPCRVTQSALPSTVFGPPVPLPRGGPQRSPCFGSSETSRWWAVVIPPPVIAAPARDGLKTGPPSRSTPAASPTPAPARRDASWPRPESAHGPARDRARTP